MTRMRTTIAEVARWRTGAALAALICSGCVMPFPDQNDAGIRLVVAAPIEIPAGSAHASFQRGRRVRGTSKLDPYCELEMRDVGEVPQRLESGEFRVGRMSRRLLLDPITRIPAVTVVTSCSDPLFQESIWRLRSQPPSRVLYLRCITPYYNCSFGPPMSPDQVQQVVGRYLAISVAPR
jgi:hypothetical protein